MAYILYCDESADKGEFYADFFGGCIINSKDLFEVETALNKKKAALNLNGEIKWNKVTSQYLVKYEEMIKLFFSFVKAGKIKVRIMFRRKNDMPSYLTRNTNEEKYFKLYYQFIKHAFGLSNMPKLAAPEVFIINLDILPDKKGQRAEFKKYLCKIPQTVGNDKIIITERNIKEVNSHDHVLLQCTDIVMGSIYFRLNHLNEAIPEGKQRRGKRTIAKEKLYKQINQEICSIHPRFNIGISTGAREQEYPHWSSPYEHWCFKPK